MFPSQSNSATTSGFFQKTTVMYRRPTNIVPQKSPRNSDAARAQCGWRATTRANARTAPHDPGTTERRKRQRMVEDEVGTSFGRSPGDERPRLLDLGPSLSLPPEFSIACCRVSPRRPAVVPLYGRSRSPRMALSSSRCPDRDCSSGRPALPTSYGRSCRLCRGHGTGSGWDPRPFFGYQVAARIGLKRASGS